jgi:hypothetical protein
MVEQQERPSQQQMPLGIHAPPILLQQDSEQVLRRQAPMHLVTERQPIRMQMEQTSEVQHSQLMHSGIERPSKEQVLRKHPSGRGDATIKKIS